VVVDRGRERESVSCRSLELVAAAFDQPLPEAPDDAPALEFRTGGLREVRAFVRRHAMAAALDASRIADLLLTVNEVATNSVRHGGGRGTLRMWSDREAVVCEVSDSGRIDHPLIGRVRPTAEQEGGRGLWLANQVCDLVQIRSLPSGNVVRLHIRR
jgi:anti-sigma regulatory factor (Ser/Thr protein kinase)